MRSREFLNTWAWRKLRYQAIQSVVAEYFGLPLIAMKSRRGSLSVARPRQIAMFLARELTAHSLPEIGRYFGGRDHTTVIHAIRRITGLCAIEPAIAHDVAMLRQQIQNPGQPFDGRMRLA